MGSAYSSNKSNHPVAETPKKDSSEQVDYRWFCENYPGDVKKDSYEERRVTAMLRNDLETKNVEDYVENKFSDLDDGIKKEVKQLIMIKMDKKRNLDQMFSSRSSEELFDEKNSTCKKVHATATVNANEERNIEEYCNDNEIKRSLKFRPDHDGKITATLIQIQLKTNSAVSNFELIVEYIKLTRQTENGSSDMETYWKPNESRIRNALQYKFNKKFGKSNDNL